MKKRGASIGTIHAAKRGALVLAAALMLGGCGGQAKDETTAVETAMEEGGAESSAEETSEAESKETEEETIVESTEESTVESAEETLTEETSKEADETAVEPAEAAEAAAAAENAPAPQAIYQSIGQNVSLPSMVAGDDNFISNYYGINPADLDGYVFASAEEATLADSIIIMKVKSSDAVPAISELLNTVIEQKAAEMENYLPEQYDIVAKSSVKTEGLYVYLVISKDAGSIESVIQSALE